MNFSQALEQLKSKAKICRAGWNGKSMWLALVTDNRVAGDIENTRVMYLPHVVLRNAHGDFVPWVCSQSDLLADDWEIAA
jgi:hypothetical protein